MDKPLNELTAEEYFEDYMLYLSDKCEVPAEQRNLTTYFAEFEHQEGAIAVSVKDEVAILVANKLMEKVREQWKELQEYMEVNMLIAVKDDGTEWGQDHPPSYEDIIAWADGYMNAVVRGIDKGGY